MRVKLELPDSIEELKQIIRDQQTLILHQQASISRLENQVTKLQHLLFGQKSERRTKHEAKNVGKRTLSRAGKVNGRRSLPEHLTRQRIDYTLDANEQICPGCQMPLQRIGEVISEQLGCISPQLYVKQHVRHKYACRHCQSKVVTATMPEQPIAKGLASSDLLASLLIDKYEDALPLYRQENRWKRLGYAITRSTLCDWVSQCAQRLKPIVTAMQMAYLLTSPKIHSDDTPIPVMAKDKTHLGRLWVYVGGEGNQSPPCVIYQYSPTRSQTAPLKCLANYQGYLQADAYAGYNLCYASGKIIEVGCWAHSRRKFVEARLHAKVPTLADTVLNYIGKLYEIERKAKELPEIKRYYYRRYHAKPWLKIIYRWLKKYQPITLPKSPLGQAIQYSLNHWQALTNYLRKGYLSIDNNCAERAIKPIVIGRKNYLFAGSHQGAENAAVIYSLIHTCKALGLNTYDYLKSVLEKLPTTLMKNIADLLPQHWIPTGAI